MNTMSPLQCVRGVSVSVCQTTHLNLVQHTAAPSPSFLSVSDAHDWEFSVKLYASTVDIFPDGVLTLIIVCDLYPVHPPTDPVLCCFFDRYILSTPFVNVSFYPGVDVCPQRVCFLTHVKDTLFRPTWRWCLIMPPPREHAVNLVPLKQCCILTVNGGLFYRLIHLCSTWKLSDLSLHLPSPTFRERRPPAKPLTRAERVNVRELPILRFILRIRRNSEIAL